MKDFFKNRPWLSRLLQWLVIAAALAAMVGGLLWLFPDLIPLLRRGDVDQMEAYLQSTNRLACIAMLALMQFVQLLSVIIPALPIHVAAGAVLRAFPGFVLCWLSFVAANVTVFWVVRHLGSGWRNKLKARLFRGKYGAPLRRLMGSGNAQTFVTLSTVMPLLPNGIVPYAASLTDLTTAQFTVCLALGSALPTLADCIVGDALMHGNIPVCVLTFGLLFGMAYLFYRHRHKVSCALDKMLKAVRLS